MKKALIAAMAPLFASIVTLVACTTIQEDPEIMRKRSEAYRREGKGWLKKRQFSQAYQKFMMAKESWPENPILHADLGLFFSAKGEHRKAAGAFQRALEIQPDFSAARNNLGKTYLQIGDNDKAIETLMPLIDGHYIYSTPQFPLFLLGRAHYNKNQYALARDYFQKAVTAEPQYVYAWVWLGRMHAITGDRDAAFAAFEKAVELSPEFADAHFYLAEAQLRTGEKKKALAGYRRVIAIAPDSHLAQKSRAALTMLGASPNP